MMSLLAEIAARLMQPKVFLTWVQDRLRDGRLDRKFGIESSARISTRALGYAGVGHVSYQPTSYLDLQAFLDQIPIGPEDVLLEVGCGMGRAICLAAMRPLKRVIGVELSPELAAVARRNVERIRPRIAAGDVEIIEGDVSELEVPEDVTLAYLFNPIRGAMLDRFLDRLAESRARDPRKLTVLTVSSPVDREFHAPFTSTGWLRRARRIELPTGCLGTVYESD